MDAIKNHKKEIAEGRREKGMSRFDIYIIFLFFVQLYIFFTISLANNYDMMKLIAANNYMANVTFVLYCMIYIILFINMFNVIGAYTKRLDNEKNVYIISVFFGTTTLLIIKFILDVLILKVRQASF
ncbi:MAG: hypothetical protein H0W89_05870 [Candidatus Levybacteria bacterium]|nr:hypothetical protein [Candidatus Levybacteria bacterium]